MGSWEVLAPLLLKSGGFIFVVVAGRDDSGVVVVGNIEQKK